jgi:cob(I)alamin adenosyltransferase
MMGKFYTQKGDDGYTGRLGKGRVPKNHQLIEAIGTIDEASAALGMGRAQSQVQETGDLLLEVQRDLYHLMAELSATKENTSQFRVIDEGRVAWVEDKIDSISKSIESPSEFIVPGDSLSGATFALARTIIRRAERRVAGLYLANEVENQNTIRYLNRLSSLCFVLELQENIADRSSGISLAKKT